MSTKNFMVAQEVRFKGLKNIQYNGKLGFVMSFPSAELTCNGRYRVQLIDEDTPTLFLKELSIKPENLEHICARCQKGGEKLLSCAKCRHSTYCNRECQRLHWAQHKETCRSLGHARDASKNPLFLAVESGNLQLVHKLVEEGIDINMTTNTTGASVILAAAIRGNLAIMQYLLQHGADKDKTDHEGRTPLIAAAVDGHLAVVQYLLEQGVDKDKALNNGATPLFGAAHTGHLPVVQRLLEHGADKDKANNIGASPLFMAAQNGHLPVVQCLLEHGADMNKVINNGAYPLFYAAMNGHFTVVKCLVEHGADKNKAVNNVIPLQIAAHKGHNEIVEYLNQS